MERQKNIPRVETVFKQNQSAITPDKITQLFNVRSAIWGTEDIESLVRVCEEIGIASPNEPEINQKIKKQIFNSYYKENFPTSNSIEEHEIKLNNSLNELIKHLTLSQSDSTFITFGSFANGKINSPHSDIDFIVILPKTTSENEINKEINKIKSLQKIGFIFSEELGSFNNLCSIIKSGKGLSRLYSMTNDGLETEYHLIGLEDAFELQYRRKSIDRVIPTNPKTEIRISFTGDRKGLQKPASFVQNFIEENGEMYKGFFTDNVATGEIIYDKNRIGNKIQETLWKSLISKFIYFNKAFNRNNRTIDFSKINFDNFLKTLYHHKKDDYSIQRIAKLERCYYFYLSRLAASHGLKIE